MMYTSPRLESEEAARSQVEHLPQLTLGHENCSNSRRKYVSGHQREQTLWQTDDCNTIAIAHKMKVSSLCNSQSNALHQTRGRKLLWYWVLLVQKVAGACDLVVKVVAGCFIIISLYDTHREKWCSSLARMRIKSLNCWSLLLLCSRIGASLVLASSTPSLPLIPAINRTA